MNAKQIETALENANLRQYVNAIDDNDGEVVIWAMGNGHPVYSEDEAVALVQRIAEL